MCTEAQIDNNVRELQELRRMREELDAEITTLEDVLKQHMVETNNYDLKALTGRVTWFENTSNRLDSAALKKELPDLYKRFSKEVKARYFRVLK